MFGKVPGWLSNFAAMNGVTFGLAIPPVIFVWIAVAVGADFRHEEYGLRPLSLCARRQSHLGATHLASPSVAIGGAPSPSSGFASALTGSLLLGWSGGGFIGVGDPYLFMTLSAVVIGGTSLLGGQGGYGFTVIGVLVLQVLTAFLVGIGLKFEWQQFIYGLLILPMVALYARSPHIRTQI